MESKACQYIYLLIGIYKPSTDSSPVSQTGEEIGLEKAHHAELIKHNISLYVNKLLDS